MKSLLDQIYTGLRRQWRYLNPPFDQLTDLPAHAEIEHAVHELAHCAHFGIDPFRFDRLARISGAVGDKFTALAPSRAAWDEAGLAQVRANERRADAVELRGVAVEMIVAARIDLTVDWFHLFQGLQTTNLRRGYELSLRQIAARVSAYHGAALTQTQVRQVMAWLNRVKRGR